MAAHLNIRESTFAEKVHLKLHQLPCTIEGSGPANVSKYFDPIIIVEENGDLKASFRGYPLLGKEVSVPENYTGVVLRETKEKMNEESDRNIYAVGLFNKLTYWNYDQPPSRIDPVLALQDWIYIAKAVG